MAVTIITSKNARVAFTSNLFEPRPADAEIDPGKYTCMLLIPKADKDVVAKVQAGIKEALGQKFKKEPVDWNSPLKDGDKYFASLDEDKAEGKEYYKGHYYLNLKSNDRPKLIDRKLNPILDRDDLNSGDYAVVSFNLSGYDTAGNKGVGAYVNVVQKVKDGEAIGGGNYLSEFSAIEDEDEEAFA